MLLKATITALCLGLVCAMWIVFQQWIKRMDPDIGNNPHCGSGCGNNKVKKTKIEKEEEQ